MSKKSFSVIIRAIVKKCLKTSAAGRWMYPFFQKCWRSVVIPMRRKRLQKHGADCLRRLHQVLTENNIQYFCNYGTLLGLVREKGFIPYDDDVDISISVNETKTPSEILKVLLSNGYRYLHGFLFEGMPREFTIIDSTGISIDVFFPTKASLGKEYGYEPLWYPNVSYPSETANTMIRYLFISPEEIVPCKVLGVEVMIPSNYEAILESEYGSKWDIPDSGFICSEDCANDILSGFTYRVSEKDFMEA